ncbi:MAG: class I SAM-dependent methyltransferase [Thermoguttaceae bacterium]
MDTIAKIWRAIKRPFRRKAISPALPTEEWLLAEKRIAESRYMVDLGCGMSPHPKASVGVDGFLTPEHRGLGTGKQIDEAALQSKGIRFVQASLELLPFEDKTFDFSYSHHVIEHVENPHLACEEIMRISSAGVIICPSSFAETVFGRPYHLWQVLTRGNTLIFIRKRKVDNCPFGKTPVPNANGGKIIVNEDSNPFDILLNDGKWYHGTESMPRLSNIIRKLWYSHSPVIETVFNWSGKFAYVVVNEDGKIVSSTAPQV